MIRVIYESHIVVVIPRAHASVWRIVFLRGAWMRLTMLA